MMNEVLLKQTFATLKKDFNWKIEYFCILIIHWTSFYSRKVPHMLYRTMAFMKKLIVKCPRLKNDQIKTGDTINGLYSVHILIFQSFISLLLTVTYKYILKHKCLSIVYCLF